MTSADKAWAVLGLGVLAYDLAAEPGMTLSEGADAWMVRHPWLVRGIAFALAAHVANAIPDRVDPIHGLFVLSRKWRRP